jgi:AcrR family transcriptional regulator
VYSPLVEERATTPRPYHSKLREEQAERTRGLIAQAARARFLDAGWSGTSVRSVAAAAGVAEATVYSIYGSKAGLASSLVDTVDADADVERLVAELQAGGGNPRAQLAAFVGFDRRLFEHGGSVLRVILEGRRQEPDLAAAYAEGRSRGERGRREVFGSWPRSAWRKGMNVNRAIDVYAIVSSIETYDIATVERGWSPDHVERWWLDTLIEQLLA